MANVKSIFGEPIVVGTSGIEDNAVTGAKLNFTPDANGYSRVLDAATDAVAGSITIGASDMEQGKWSNGLKSSDANYIRSARMFPVVAGQKLTITLDSTNRTRGIVYDPTDLTTILLNTSFKSVDYETTLAVSGYLVVQVQKGTGGTAIAPSDYSGTVTIETVTDESVTTAMLADESVTTDKLDDEAVTTDKIDDNAVTKEKLGGDVIISDEGFGWTRVIDPVKLDADGLISVTKDDMESGGWTSGVKNQSSTRIRCGRIIPVAKGMQLVITPIDCQISVIVYDRYDPSQTVLNTGFASGRKTLTIPDDGYAQIVSRVDSTNPSMAVSDFGDSSVAFIPKLEYSGTDVMPIIWESGGYNGNNKTTNTDRARSSSEYVVTTGQTITVHTPIEAKIFILISEGGAYASTKSYLGNSYENDATHTIPSGTDLMVHFMLVFASGHVVSTDEIEVLNKLAVVTDGSAESGTYVYQFGGEGNDWCFVRLPPDYSPNRARPYPFVICNHGNGWTMDGTLEKANWTKRTMYVPLDDPDYIANPSQYNGTSDSSLWYSNPTIEALLAAGYVVCGCENHADALYGNDDNRKACADFFWHMQRNYNVEDRCCMIGASNGAQTSINAAYILGERVKAMILQYPLTCLVNQYFGNSSHQAGIRSAYGISDTSIDEAGLVKATATHDLLHTNMAGSVKVGYFPPTRFYYSLSDTTTDAQDNTLPAYELLYDSNYTVEKVQCTGGHGDASHFAPADYVAFFERY